MRISFLFLLFTIHNTFADVVLDGGNSGWDTSRWRTTLDGVMGGRSSGTLRYEDNNRVMFFSGSINLNGGGFSSVRKSISTTDMSAYAGIVVDLVADKWTGSGAPLGLHLQLNDASSRYGYAAAFAIPFADSDDTTTSVFIPMDGFDKGSAYGFECRGCALDISRVNGIDIYVLFQEGPFAFRVKSIRAVKEVKSFMIPAISFNSKTAVMNLLQDTIKSGSSLYDKNYRELCNAQYWSALNSVIAASKGVSKALKGVACAGLIEAVKPLTKEERAWTMRHTMNALLDDMNGQARKTNKDYLPSVEDAEDYADICEAKTNFHVPPPDNLSGGNDMESFLGPFSGMGITGYNDLGRFNVGAASGCGSLCLLDPKCKSFDYGVIGNVKGDCWLSTANRESAGSAYTRWQMYDYYELKPIGEQPKDDDDSKKMDDECMVENANKKSCKKKNKKLKSTCSFDKGERQCVTLNSENCGMKKGKKQCKDIKGCKFNKKKCGL